MAENKGGRPPKLTKALGTKICELICEKYTLRQIEKMDGMPVKSNIVAWQFKEGPIYRWFQEQYARALKIRAFAWSEECIDIADDGSNDWYMREGKVCADHEHIQRSRVRIDTRKFIISKVLPKVFGDNPQQDGGLQPKDTEINFVRGETRKSQRVKTELNEKSGTEDN